MKLRSKLSLLDIACSPLSFIIYNIYKYCAPFLLDAYFNNFHKLEVHFFIRQGLKSSHKKFNFLFSDLDLGVITDSVDFNVIVRDYYKLKHVLRFLGELEIYTSVEYKSLLAIGTKYKVLYERIRKVRQLNWLVNRLMGLRQRNKYHRLKDARKVFLLKSELGIASPLQILDILFNELSSFTLVSNESQLEDFAVFYCDYLSCTIKFTPTNSAKLILILSSLPLKNRNLPELDKATYESRKMSSEIKAIFENLNLLEFLIAKAFIRGAIRTEGWHQKWLSDLEDGL